MTRLRTRATQAHIVVYWNFSPGIHRVAARIFAQIAQRSGRNLARNRSGNSQKISTTLYLQYSLFPSLSFRAILTLSGLLSRFFCFFSLYICNCLIFYLFYRIATSYVLYTYISNALCIFLPKKHYASLRFRSFLFKYKWVCVILKVFFFFIFSFSLFKVYISSKVFVKLREYTCRGIFISFIYIFFLFYPIQLRSPALTMVVSE